MQIDSMPWITNFPIQTAHKTKKMGSEQSRQKYEADKESPCHDLACKWQKCFRANNYDNSKCVYEKEQYDACMKAYLEHDTESVQKREERKQK